MGTTVRKSAGLPGYGPGIGVFGLIDYFDFL